MLQSNKYNLVSKLEWCMQVIRVLIPQIGLFPLDYLVSQSDEVKLGDIVRVQVRRKEISAIVWEIDVESCYNIENLKYIIKDNDLFKASIDKKHLEFIKITSEYYLAKLGSICKLVLPVDVNESPIKLYEQEIANFNLPILSQDQQEILCQIEEINKPIILKGVTGSGKTEIYFHLVAQELMKGKQVLILLPEIALSMQIISRFKQRFGFDPVIWNSTVTKAQKKRILRGIIQGSVRLVIGARSALFLPYNNLSLIVIDEEHDASYKQNDGILYNARDMAVLRSKIYGNKVMLVSATPSLESVYNAQNGKYELLELKTRYQAATMPEIDIIDMREQNLGYNSWLSEELIAAIKANIKQGLQSLLFLNRKGYAPLLLCSSCGYRFACANCSTSLVMHKSEKKLKCHHCGYIDVIPSECKDCGESETLRLCGPGIERIAEEVKNLFPKSKIALISRFDSGIDKDFENTLKDIESGKIDILIGTQVITKGYHFPNLTLVGVIDADYGFSGCDLRSSERTYQLLHQVGGRAGREKDKGRVVLQTYYPDNKLLNALKNYDDHVFVQEEMESRSLSAMPPFGKMASIIVTGKNVDKLENFAKHIVRRAPKTSAKILGPAEAVIFKVSNRYRYKILILTKKGFNIQKYLSTWLDEIKVPSEFHMKIDIDPYHFV